jgi:hypothetical protein
MAAELNLYLAFRLFAGTTEKLELGIFPSQEKLMP